MKENRVQKKDSQKSKNYFMSDKLLVDYIFRYVNNDAFTYMGTKWKHLGKLAAGSMNELSLMADKNPPELKKRDAWGEDINEVVFHQSYWELMDTAAESEMLRVKWDPALRKRFHGSRHLLGFISGYLFAQSEMGQYCPLCMSDGAAYLIDKYATDADKKRLLPGFALLDGRRLSTGAMYLTEKSGGSDIGNNLVTAERSGDYWNLNGEKWFCSNVNADVAMVLARTDSNTKGTKGLSVFMVEKFTDDNSRNPIEIIRLKDKLGVRSMASAECMLRDTKGTLIGEENGGLKVMLDMVNISRIYNSIAALAGTRRAITEAIEFAVNRITFGKTLSDHTLYRYKVWELTAKHNANFHLVMRTIRALDNAESGDEKEAELLRLLTPMAKWWSAEAVVYLTRECMELMGGIGYIEDQVMPKLLRDVNVLPIWEGSGNIIVLDMLRSVLKTDAANILFEEIIRLKEAYCDNMIVDDEIERLKQEFRKIKRLDSGKQEILFKHFANDAIRLYQVLMIMESIDSGADYLHHTLQYLLNEITGDKETGVEEMLQANIQELVGWQF